MKHYLAAALVIFTTTGVVNVAGAQRLKNMEIEFPPDSVSLPAGPNLSVVNRNCMACHSAEMILSQPVLTRAVWATEVTKMRNVYKAPIADADVGPILDYLAALK